MSLRLIAGEKGGLGLQAPRGRDTRPTLGRVREALFSMLAPRLPGAHVADLFAGSGALGLEALSRGAATALMVEKSRPALAALNTNIERTGWHERIRVEARDVFSLLRQPPPEGMPALDLVLLDPPYERDLALRTLEALASTPAWLAPGACVVAQIERRGELPEHVGPLIREKSRTWGETRADFYAFTP